MKDIHRKRAIVKGILFGIFLIFAALQIIMRIKNAELTEAQMVIEYWYLYAGLVVTGCFYYIFPD